MATLASLNVVLSATSAGFTAGLRKAEGGLSSFVSKVSSVQGALAGIAGAAGVGIIANELTSLVKGSLESIDSVAKLSDRLAISTEALTGLQHAADLAGISNESLAGALEKMLKNLDDAASKGGEAAASLSLMGLNAQALVRTTPDAAFKAIADGLSKIQNPAQRAGAAMDLFGKAGQGLLPLMLSGAAGIAEAQKEAQKLGLTFSRIDAAQVEATNDAFTRVHAVITGIGNQLAIAVAPYAEAVAKSFTDWAGSGEGLKGISGSVESIAVGLGHAGDVLDIVTNAFRELKMVVLGVEAEVVGLFSILTGGKFTTIGAANFAAAKDIIDQMVELGNEINAVSMRDLSKDAEEAFAKIRKDAEDSARAVAAAAAARNAGPRVTINPEAAKAAQKLATDVTTLNAKLTQQVAVFGQAGAQAEIYALAQRGATTQTLKQAQALADQLKALEQQKKVQEELASLAEQAAQATMGDRDSKLAKLSAGGATLQDLAKAAELLDRIDQAHTFKTMAEDAGRLRVELMSPLEKFQNELDKLATLFEEGLISPDLVDRGGLKALADLQGNVHTRDFQLPSAPAAVTHRFTEGIAASRGTSGNNLEKNTGSTAKNTADAKYLLQRLLAEIQSRGGPTVVGIGNN